MQQAGFGHFHAASVAGTIMFVAPQVQRAVHHQMGHVMRDTPAGRRRLSPDDTQGQHQFGRRVFIGQDVGCLLYTSRCV